MQHADWILPALGLKSYIGLSVSALAVFAAGLLRGFVGFGASLVIVMVLSVVLGPVAAVPIANLTGLPSGIQLLPDALRHSERSFVITFGISAFVAAPFGALVLVTTEPAVMKMAISLFVLAMVLMLYRGWRIAKRPGLGFLYAAGSAAGFLQGAAGVGGPPAVVIALSRPGTPQFQRANVIGAVTALSLSSIPPLWYLGLFTREVVVMSLAMMPLYLGGTWLGARFFSSRGHRHYRNAALLALAVVGVVTFAVAIRDYGTG